MFQNFSCPDEMLNVTSTPGSSCWTQETISVSRDERGWLMMTLLCEAWSRVTVSHWVLSSVGVVTRHREDDPEQCGQWRPGDGAVSVEQRQSISEQRLHWLLVLVCTSFPLLHWSHWNGVTGHSPDHSAETMIMLHRFVGFHQDWGTRWRPPHSHLSVKTNNISTTTMILILKHSSYTFLHIMSIASVII